MRRSSIAGWTAFGVLSLTALAVFGDSPIGASAAETRQVASIAPALAMQTNTVSIASLAVANTSIAASSRSAVEAARCELSSKGIEAARKLMFYQRLEEADELLTTLLELDCLEQAAERDQARFQHAYLLFLLQRPADSLARLDALETEVPVADYVDWLRGESLEKLGRHSEAADAFGAIYAAETSPLHWRARARQAKALVAAERWEEARPALQQIIDTFPDFPRRHRVLHELGLTFEALGDLPAAAKAHQRAHFEFPYRAEGDASLARLAALAEQGVRPEPLDREVRFEQYRQLSVDKFWPLAHQLLTDLREEYRTPEGNTAFENQILLQLAMNAYHSHDFEKASHYFQEAREIYEAGHTRGFHERTLYRFYSFALARLHRYDEAIDSLETFHRNSPRNTRLREIASHYERHGQYESAYQLYDQIYTAAQKRQWHFSYLKYKTGRFDEAYENLRNLAARSRGESRAQYLYWAARSLERANKEEEAYEIFSEIRDAHRTSYYGLLATSRIHDLEQRRGSDGTFLAQSDLLLDQANQALDAFDAPRQGNRWAAADFRDPRAQPVLAAPVYDEENPLQNQEALLSFLREFCDAEGRCTARQMGQPIFEFAMQALPERLLSGQTDLLALPGQAETIVGLDRADSEQARIPRSGLNIPSDIDSPRVRFNTEARIYWDGRHDSDIGFVNYSRGKMIGPVPRQWSAYDDDTHVGGLRQAVDEAGELFPNLERAKWLWQANWNTEARRVMRDVTLEYRSLTSRARANRAPHALPHRRWAYYIDNRRRNQRADLWGMSSSEERFPVPEGRAERQALLERQQAIFDRRRELQPLMVKAMQEVGDYHFVRRHALGDTWWLRHAPEGEARRYWAMAYPRAFPEKVIPLAEHYNINPYMIWALMLVESSFNPDSISIADAKGLLQVIPRTGLKIAELFGSEDFGPFDLLEEDHSIEQGIFYFSRLVQKFHGQELLAFAGYNGGPHRIGAWLDYRGHRIPHDEFIEEIPFDESRNYAKKVLRFLHIYLRIYEGYDEGLYVGQNVRRDYLEQPDF